MHRRTGLHRRLVLIGSAAAGATLHTTAAGLYTAQEIIENPGFPDRRLPAAASVEVTMAMAQHEGCDVEVPLVEAIRSGDRYAFGELVRRHSRWVRGVIYSVLGRREGVEDATQQVWVAVWTRIGELRDANRWRPWLYRLARNAAVDALRQGARRRQRRQRLAADPPPAPPVPKPGQELEDDERFREVLAAIQALPPLYREPFVMRHLNGWTYSEIAEAMGMSGESVETRLVRARRLLRESLKEKVV